MNVCAFCRAEIPKCRMACDHCVIRISREEMAKPAPAPRPAIVVTDFSPAETDLEYFDRRKRELSRPEGEELTS